MDWVSNEILVWVLDRATPSGTRGVKTIGNYVAVLKAQSAAKAKGFSDVLYLDWGSASASPWPAVEFAVAQIWATASLIAGPGRGRLTAGPGRGRRSGRPQTRPPATARPLGIQVSNTKKPLFFFVNLAKTYMQQYNEVELSALGMAIATVVTMAEILKNNGFAAEKKITTSTVGFKDESRGRPVQKAKMEILLGKSEMFDELMAATAEQADAGATKEEQS
ncbi:hypothetical protein NL676_021840 [Syzygium grande]|nr:hypothetical protein NL676_021840 [Syzygium grande]